jgi:hypothetical protein
MKFPKKSVLAILASVLMASQASASIVISIFAGRLDVADGSGPVGAGTLLQLVNLGADGVFNPINIADGDASQFGQWVSGDDSLVNLSFMVDGAAGDFASAAAFDLRHSSATESTTGRLSRVFDFASGSITGLKLGIRWFPGLQATNFASTTLALGQAYGQFTRQAAPVNGGSTWTVPFVDGTITFDSLVTTEASGPDLPVAGDANLSVVPEPAAIGMSLLGAAGLAMLRRRRA